MDSQIGEWEIHKIFTKPVGSVTTLTINSCVSLQELGTLEIVTLDGGYASFQFYYTDFWGKFYRNTWQCGRRYDILAYINKIQEEDWGNYLFTEEMVWDTEEEE